MWRNRTLSFCSIFFVVFPTVLSSVNPTKDRHIHLHNMESVSIIIRKDIWRIISSVQRTKRTFRGNRDIIWGQIWVIAGSFMWAGYVMKVNGR